MEWIINTIALVLLVYSSLTVIPAFFNALIFKERVVNMNSIAVMLWVPSCVYFMVKYNVL